MSKRLKVVVVDPLCQGPYYDYYLCSALQRAGMDVELWTREPKFLKDYFSHTAFRVRKLTRFSRALFGESSFGKFFKYLELLTIDFFFYFIKCLRSDVVHIQWFSPPPMLYVERYVYSLLKNFDIRLVFTAHNVFPHSTPYQFKKELQKIYSTFHTITVMNTYSKTILSNEFSLATTNVEIIPHGPIFHDFIRLSQTQSKQKLNIDVRMNVILFQGFLRAYKGIDFLLETFSRFLQLHPNSILVLAGMGKSDYVLDVKKSISRLSIPETNILAPFQYVTPNQIPIYYASADVVVFPYEHIYQSGALFTAMSFKKAVIATDVGGFAELIENNINGKLIEYGNTEQFISALQEIIFSKEKKEMFEKNAFHKVTNECSWEMIAEKTINVYRKP
ncbi:MAG: glycosyltransferase family 4 protein [Ignavibacteria bacterium]|nr:glycosyltransferase family 4 protein [Ignavibacteria bacterium]